MKRFAAAVLGLMLLVSISVPASAYNYYNDTWLPEYRIVSAVADNQLYMYPKASSSGNPISAYPIGTILRVIDWNIYQSGVYCYAIGPDNKVGYVRKTCLVRCYEAEYIYDDDSFPGFEVTSTFRESGYYRVYMYPEPSSNGQPVSGTGYVNGTILKVIDYYCDDTYCFCIGPDEHTGFVRKAWLTYSYGEYPDPEYSQPASYYTGKIY